MSYTVPPAAVRVLRDALAEAQAAGITEPAAAAQHAACALAAHGWHVSGNPNSRKDNR